MSESISNKAIISSEDRSSVASYAKWPVAFVKGLGCALWDADGDEYLDLYGGHCVALLCHCHPRWVEAVKLQADELGFYSNVAYSDARAVFQERLVRFAPDRMSRVFLCNSGAEANETAVKLAIKATKRSGIVAMKGGFHGRTAGALSLTHLGGYRKQFPSIVRETKAVELGDFEELKACLDDDTAAVILEPIQSMNGVKSADPDYYPALVEACHANGTLVIFDEIQTGIGRLGARFAADLFGAEVDLMTLAKGLGNGFPVAAVLASEEVAGTVEVGEQGTTFGGGPMACAAGAAVLEVVEEERLVERAKKMEIAAREMLVRGPVAGVRGRGLLIGLETKAPARDLCRYLFDRKILTGTSADPGVVRLMPPLVVEESHIERLADELGRYPQ